ncbi:hypothetical protein MKW94_009069 [Papaver nudicaule]|uniref:Uncharacterized protein n=1 Tax=Papaver nudicaule TaxID=74823 RepID=A0AA42AWF0_PAPNU|nr:hypothetical protein [Papaver nudicaule]
MEGKGSVALLPLKKKNDFESVLTQVQTKMGELKKGFDGWICKQPWPVRTAVEGVAMGLFYGCLAKSETANYFYPFEEFGATRLLVIRNFAILKVTDGAMVCAMKKIRGGEDDTLNRAVAGFTSGYLFEAFKNSPACGGPEAIVSGVVFAVCQGLLHEMRLRSESSQLPVADTCYTRTRSMLSNLGLQDYENHFKKNLLMDSTMPLLKESHLLMAGIPLGPSILIMNHIERDPDLRKMRGS